MSIFFYFERARAPWSVWGRGGAEGERGSQAGCTPSAEPDFCGIFKDAAGAPLVDHSKFVHSPCLFDRFLQGAKYSVGCRLGHFLMGSITLYWTKVFNQRFNGQMNGGGLGAGREPGLRPPSYSNSTTLPAMSLVLPSNKWGSQALPLS